MAYVYFIYLLIIILLHKASSYFLISPELRKIPSIPLITGIKWNIGLYLLGVPLATNIRKFLLEPIEETGIIKYYDILWRRWIVFVSQPCLLKEINTRTDAFQKIDAENRPMSDCEYAYIGRKNILFENKEEHIRHRRVANPSFHQIWPTELFGNVMKELFEELDKDLKVNNTVNVQAMTQAFTLEALGKAAFGYNFGAVRKLQTQLIKSYNATMRGIADMKYSMFPILEKIPGFKRTHLIKHIDFINHVILSIIDKRKKNQALGGVTDKNPELENKDLLHCMLKAEADEVNLKKRLTTEELMNDLKIFLIAGHDSTASALSASIYYLGKNLDCQQKAREEVLRVMGDEEQDVIPTLDQIKEMKYISMVINETLRIHPPAPALNARVTQKDTRLGEYVLPKGQLVIPNLYALHHSKKLWGDEPYKFQPERFAGSEGDAIQSSYKFTPFGGGVRICIGMNFSLAEQRVFLAMLVKKYQWTIPKETIHGDRIEIGRTYLSLLIPKDLHATFERRY